MPDLPTRYAWIKPGVLVRYVDPKQAEAPFLGTVEGTPYFGDGGWRVRVRVREPWQGIAYGAECSRLTPRTEETDDAPR